MAHFSNAQDYVLFHFYILSVKGINDGTATTNEILPAIGNMFPAKLIEKALNEVRKKSWVTPPPFGTGTPGDVIEITTAGLNYVDSQIDEFEQSFLREVSADEDEIVKRLMTNFSSTSPSGTVPASNRHVLASDNQDAVNDAQQALSRLREAVDDNRDNDFEDKEEVLSDLAVLEAAFSQPQINTALVEKIFNATIKYLAVKFADNAIGIASNALILATSKFIGLV